jgi:hypothetical protein
MIFTVIVAETARVGANADNKYPKAIVRVRILNGRNLTTVDRIDIGKTPTSIEL